MKNTMPSGNAEGIKMKTAYEFKQKMILMTLTIAASLILLGLKACQ